MRFKKSTPIFSFTPSYATDLKKTFARIRKEQAEAAKASQAVRHEKILKVRNIK